MASLRRALFAFALCVSAAAFPVGPLDIGKLLDELKKPPSLAKDIEVTKLIVEHLQVFFSAKDHAIVVHPSDITGLHKTMPDEQLDNDCKHDVKAESPTVSGTIMHDSSLMFGVSKIQWQNLQIFADALVDYAVEVDTDTRVSVGQPWKALGKHHCTHLGQKTFGLKIKGTGKVSLGTNASCTNARVEKAKTGNGLDLVFTFKVNHVSMAMPNWNVDVDTDDCKIMFMGIKIGSYCGIVVDKVKQGIAQSILKINTVSLPAVEARIEQIIQTKIGSEVRIPLIHIKDSQEALEVVV